MEKIVLVDRESVDVDRHNKFTFIDPNGMRWYGDCVAIDHGPLGYYAITGKVTGGPSEWVGLRIIISGVDQDSKLSLRPLLDK